MSSEQLGCRRRRHPRLRINAYLLAADPAWIEASVRSYYDLVERIVVSYDETGTSWTGSPIDVAGCLSRLHAIDTDHKLDLSPGRYSFVDRDPMDNDTGQRQAALDRASEDADWVLQLDTDEVLADSTEFARCIDKAEARGRCGVEYPARYVYAYAGSDRYLELSDRFWRTRSAFPGPVAVRAGTRLTFARQGPRELYRVDFRPYNCDPAHPKDARVDRVINSSQAISHYSRVRSAAQMRSKAESNGHRYDWDRLTEEWQQRSRHPWRTVLRTPLTRNRHWDSRLRLTRRLPPVPTGTLDREALDRG